MQFINYSAFDAQCFAKLDQNGQEYWVVAMKAGYRLIADPNRPGTFMPQPMDKKPAALCPRDQFYGRPHASSIHEAGDYVPYKPQCDVLVRGHTWAPSGIPKRRWTPRICITVGKKPEAIPDPEPPQPLNQVMQLTNDQLRDWAKAERKVQRQRETAALAATERDVLLDKRLRVTGPRWFKRGFLRLWLRWRLTRPKKATQVPLRWEHAFGGSSILPNPKHQKNPKKPEYLVHGECYSNPVGCGWIDKRHFRKARKAGKKRPWTIPAPQFYYRFRPIRRLRRKRASGRALSIRKMVRIARRLPTPAGFGPTARDWLPRAALFGTFDDQARRAYETDGRLPADFDARYYNCAPADQQIDFPRPESDIRIELWHLIRPDLALDGYGCIVLPDHRPFVAIYIPRGQIEARLMDTDTVCIDTDAMTLTLTHRVQVAAAVARRLEARLERDPDAPLLQYRQPDDQDDEQDLQHQAAG